MHLTVHYQYRYPKYKALAVASCALRALHGGRLLANYRGFLIFNFINERAWDPRLSPLFSRSQRSNSLLFRVVPPDVIPLAT